MVSQAVERLEHERAEAARLRSELGTARAELDRERAGVGERRLVHEGLPLRDRVDLRRTHERPLHHQEGSAADAGALRGTRVLLWKGPGRKVEAEALPQRCLELVRPVADDDDPRKVEAEGEQLAGQKRTVRVREHAVDELASCDDDRGARPVQAVAVEALMPLGPTMKYPVSVPGAGTVFPFSFQVRLPG